MGDDVADDQGKIASDLVSGHLLELGARVAGLGLGSVDYLSDTITLDDRAADLFGLPAHVPVPRSDLHARIHADDRPAVEAEVSRLLRPGQPDFIDVVHRVTMTDGSERWVSARKQVFFGPDPVAGRRPVSGLVALMDVTDHKRAEQRISGLLREMNHRQKNLLTVVQAIARMTARTAPPDGFLAMFDQRIKALAHNQDLLVRRGPGGLSLDALIREQVQAFAGDGSGQVSLSGPIVSLTYDAIQPIGMAINELATNATKHGALQNSEGRVTIAWSLDDTTFTLHWQERNGPPVTPPQRRGFGTTVLQGMTQAALEAQVALDHAPEGVSWRIVCPRDRVVAGPDDL